MGDRDINREMVREGYAWVYRKYVRDESLLADEKHAQSEKVGLWGLVEAEQLPPWEWRSAKRGQGANEEAASIEADEGFTCGTKTLCRHMASCAEARFFLTKCRLVTLDGDRDGVPCEAICR
jgi:hypothetical protein